MSPVSTTTHHRRDLTRWLITHTRGLLPPLVFATLARIVGLLLGIAVLTTAASALVTVATGSQITWWHLALTITGLSLTKAALRYLEHYLGHWVAFTALQRLRELLFARLIPQAPAATTGRASAEITERATRDIDRIEVFFAHTIPPVIASVVTPVIALTWLAVAVDPRPALIIALFLGAALLLPFVAGRPSWAVSRANLAARARVATHVTDDIQGLREVLAFEARSHRLNSLADRDAEVTTTQLRIGRVVGTRGLLDRLLWGGCLAVLLLSGTPAEVVAIAAAVMTGLWLAESGTDDFATGLDAAFAACARVRSIADAPPVVADTGRRVPAHTGAPSITIEDVTFGYPGTDRPAVIGVTVRCAPGSWHYLTGPSGSGKSTIAALLVRAWDPVLGQILLDGVPLTEFSLDALRETVAIVDQRPVLFPGTIADNLRLGRPGATERELGAALSSAGLDPASLPDGLDTAVGERGSALSGGQVQRVAIARALVAEPRVLVLDEALSQLDADTAARIREHLAELPLTILEITHRADVIPDPAPVTVLDRGAVIEHGSAADLRDRRSAFARLALRT